MKRTITYVMLCILAVSCAKWNETESVRIDIDHPWSQEPEQWEQYFEQLNRYKAGEHMIAYGRLFNSPDKAHSEKDYMRSLPDSLDIVCLTNADNFSENDASDMEWMKKVGTKVLYQIDFASRESEFSGNSGLSAYLDEVIASVKRNGLDGYAFTGKYKPSDAASGEASSLIASLIVKKLYESKEAGMLIAFEGDPLFVNEEDRSKIDFFVLDTDDEKYVQNILLKVRNATSRCGIPQSKVLLTASLGATVFDEDKTEIPSIDMMTGCAVSYGPLGGIAIADISKDYYHSGDNYVTVRKAIQTLNPSK